MAGPPPEHPDTVRGRVQGVSGGQVAIGGRVVQIDAAQGAHVVVNAESDVRIVRRPPPVLRPAPAFPSLVDRTGELQRVRAALAAGTSVEVFGPGGVGKSVLLRAASNTGLTSRTPDGVVAVPARLGVADTLSYLFDACYEGTRRLVPRREELASSLHDLRLLVVLDDAGLDRDELEELREAMPASLFLLAGSEQRLFEGVDGLALSGLADEDGVALIQATVGRALSRREHEVGAQVCQVLQGNPLELVRFASLVRAGSGDLVGVARGFGVDAGPEDLLLAVQRSVSADEDAVLVALAAFGVPVGAGPVAAYSGRPDAGELLFELAQRGLVQGDDLHGWQARVRAEAPVEDRHRAAVVLTTWVRERSIPEEVAAEVPVIAGVLEASLADRRWIDVVVLAAAAEQALALVGRWAAWGETLRAGLTAAEASGDVPSARFFAHQLGVMEEAMTSVPHVARAPRPATRSGPPAASRRPTRPRRRRGWVVLGGLLLTLAVCLLVVLGVGDHGDDGMPGTAPATTGQSAEPSDTGQSAGPSDTGPSEDGGQSEDGGPPTAGAESPNVTAVVTPEPPAVALGEDVPVVVHVANEALDGQGVAPVSGAVLTATVAGSAAELVEDGPGCELTSGSLSCELETLDVGGSADLTLMLRGVTSGSVDVNVRVESPEGTLLADLTTSLPVVCVVPDVQGWPLEDAEGQLSTHGLVSERVLVEQGLQSEMVVGQDPAPSTPVDCGSTVTLTYSTLG